MTEWTANKFVRFMETIWEIQTEPTEGGMTLREHDLYGEYGIHPHATVRRFGAYRTGGSFINGEPANVYRFPADGEYAAVRITYDGHGCDAITRKYGRKGRT